MFIVFDSLVDDKGNSLRAAPASGASQTSGIFRFLCVSEQKHACRERTGGVYPVRSPTFRTSIEPLRGWAESIWFVGRDGAVGIRLSAAE